MSNIDDIFKKGLENAGMPYGDSHWSAMEKQLPVKAAFPWWKFAASGVGVVALATLLYFGLSSTGVGVNEIETSQNETVLERNNSIPNENANEKVVSDKSVALDNFEGIREQLNDGPKNSSTQSSTKSSSHTNQRLTSNNTILSDNSTIGSNPQFLSIVNEDDVSEIINRNSALEDFTSNIEDKINTSVVLNESDYTNEGIRSKRIIKVSEPIDLNSSISIKKIKRLRPRYIPKWELSVSPFAEFAAYRNNISLANSILDELNNVSNSKELLSYNYGFKVSFKKGNWGIYSGLLSNRLEEETNYIGSESYYDFETKLRMINGSYTTTPRGTRVVLVQEEKVDSTLVTQSVPLCTDCNTQVSYITIPIGLNYSFGKGKLTYFGELEGLYSRLNSFQGDYALVNGNEAIEVREIHNTDLNQNVFSGSLAMGINYKLMSRVSVWSSIGVRQTMQSTLKAYDQNARVSPARLGVKVKL